MTINKCVTVNNFVVKLDFSLDCKSVNCIYLAICRHCIEKQEFYFGKTVTPAHIRFNGHKGCFKLENLKFEDSALSHHIYFEHPEFFGDKLANFMFGIVKDSSAMQLNRLEDYYVYSTKADKISLNRYKVAS